MKLKAKAGKIVGRSREEVWGQVFQSDSLFLVVEILVPEGFEAAPLGKEIIDAIYAHFIKLPTVNLKTLKELLFLKDGRLLNLQIPQGATLNLILATVVNHIFYLLVLGQGSAFLKRGEKMATLLEGEGSGSGRLEENDLLILTSPKFNQIVSFETLKSALNNLPLQEIAENLAPLVHAQEDSFGAAAMILRFEKKEEHVEEEGEKEAVVGHKLFQPLFSRIKPLITSRKFFLMFPSFALKRRVSEEERTKKMVLTVALVLTALLIASIIFGFGKKKRMVQEERFQQVSEVVIHKYEEGKALLDLNTQKSRELLGEAKSLLEEARAEFKKGSKERRKIEALLEKVEVALKEAEKVYKLSDVPLFFDPVFLKDKAFGEGLSLYKESLAILDRRQNTLYYLALREKKGKILAGGEKLKGTSLVGIHGEKVYALVDEGIVEVNIKNQKANIKIEEDKDWGEIVDLVAYRGNVYLLDEKEIAKYLRTDEGFLKRDYLAPGTKVDFSSVSSMAIDGDIWLAIKEGVLRFSLGQRKEFLAKGLEKELGSHLLIYTDEECEKIYILDKSNLRIVVLNKEGEYQAQYEWEKLAQAQDLVVSEKERRILVLVEGKIYTVDLKS